MSRLPSFCQAKAAHVTSSTELSPSSSPDHFQRHSTAEFVRHSDSMETSIPVRPKRHHQTAVQHRGGVHVWGDRDKVVLLVDEKRFSICPNLLIRQPNTMLGRYVSHMTSQLCHMTSQLCHMTSQLCHMTSQLCHITSQLCHITSQLCHMTSQLCHMTSQLCHMTSQLCHMTSQLCHITSQLCHMTSPPVRVCVGCLGLP